MADSLESWHSIWNGTEPVTTGQSWEQQPQSFDQGALSISAILTAVIMVALVLWLIYRPFFKGDDGVLGSSTYGFNVLGHQVDATAASMQASKPWFVRR